MKKGTEFSGKSTTSFMDTLRAIERFHVLNVTYSHIEYSSERVTREIRLVVRYSDGYGIECLAFSVPPLESRMLSKRLNASMIVDDWKIVATGKRFHAIPGGRSSDSLMLLRCGEIVHEMESRQSIRLERCFDLFRWLATRFKYKLTDAKGLKQLEYVNGHYVRMDADRISIGCRNYSDDVMHQVFLYLAKQFGYKVE